VLSPKVNFMNSIDRSELEVYADPNSKFASEMAKIHFNGNLALQEFEGMK
jgi:hypothetical protein